MGGWAFWVTQPNTHITRENEFTSHCTMAAAIAANTLRKHAHDAAVVFFKFLFWHHIKASDQWPMKFSNYLKSSLRLSSISLCERGMGLCNVWLEFISKDVCLCCHRGGKMEKKNPLTGMHTHTFTAQPLNTAETTLGSTVPHNTSTLNDS